jgi:MoxR-like ATPase
MADEGLKNAVNVALALGQPLLVTGEPGTGKTELAQSVAYELGLGEPLVFNTKTTATAKDLFYRYDAISHFRSAQMKEGASTKDFITFEALGKAIQRAATTMSFDDPLPIRSLVLIDEIDKAPRDLPNDVLNEIDRLEFTVVETGTTYKADPAYRPVVIMTSNSEKHLPDAFLRRCVFYYIPFPDAKKLETIVRGRLQDHPLVTGNHLEKAIDHFLKLRDLPVRKKPATAEFLAWAQIPGLEKLLENPNAMSSEQKDALRLSYAVLAKTIEDQKTMEESLGIT